jgi:GTP cyclohydrolase FolE2
MSLIEDATFKGILTLKSTDKSVKNIKIDLSIGTHNQRGKLISYKQVAQNSDYYVDVLLDGISNTTYQWILKQ